MAATLLVAPQGDHVISGATTTTTTTTPASTAAKELRQLLEFRRAIGPCEFREFDINTRVFRLEYTDEGVEYPALCRFRPEVPHPNMGCRVCVCTSVE
jgi:hypothetical protein